MNESCEGLSLVATAVASKERIISIFKEVVKTPMYTKNIPLVKEFYEELQKKAEKDATRMLSGAMEHFIKKVETSNGKTNLRGTIIMMIPIIKACLDNYETTE